MRDKAQARPPGQPPSQAGFNRYSSSHPFSYHRVASVMFAIPGRPPGRSTGLATTSSSSPSWRTAGPSPRLHELLDAPQNVVSDPAHGLDWLSLRVFKWPVLALQLGDHRALLTAAHGHQERRSARKLVAQELRRCP